MGASRKVAPEVVGRVLALQRDAQAREVAVSLFKEGHSAAQVWAAAWRSPSRSCSATGWVPRPSGGRVAQIENVIVDPAARSLGVGAEIRTACTSLEELSRDHRGRAGGKRPSHHPVNALRTDR